MKQDYGLISGKLYRKETNANARQICSHKSDCQGLEKAGSILFRRVRMRSDKGPERDMSGAWLDQVTSLRNAHLRGVHLSLPGYGDDGPTLEIFSYSQLVEADADWKPVRVCPYRVCGRRCEPGVADADRSRWRRQSERLPHTEVGSVGLLRVVYAGDPEGNIVELQKWN